MTTEGQDKPCGDLLFAATTPDDERHVTANCPKCGRFSRLIEEGRDWQGGWYADLRCTNCGEVRLS